MKKTTFVQKIFSLVLALACCTALLIMPASAQGGSFEYSISTTITNNDFGGTRDGVTYLAKDAVVTLRFSLPTGTNIASGEVHIEYDPTKYSAAVNPDVVTVANMSADDIASNSAREYAKIPEPWIKDIMNSSNYICQFYFATDDATGDMGGGIICEVSFTVIAGTATLTPANAQDGGFRIVSAMANEDTGTVIAEDIAKDGLSFGVNNTTNAYKFAQLPKKQILMFDYDTTTRIDSVDLSSFVKLLTNTITITNEYLRISDIDRNGVINSIDYAAIKICITRGEGFYEYIYVDV